MKNVITVIGFGLSKKDLPKASIDVIYQADLLVGGRRHLDAFEDFKSEKVVVCGQIKAVLDDLETAFYQGKKVVILASGDPLYYGIGSLVSERFGAEQVKIIPNVSAVAGAFSRLGLSWQDAKIVSLHGRELTPETFKILLSSEKVAFYTDKTNTPDAIAKQMLDEGITVSEVHVFEQMGTQGETWTRGTLEEIGAKRFDPTNMMVVVGARRFVDAQPIGLGMPSEVFAHQRAMITKPEVRAVTLSKLDLKAHQILWDLGAGSGSISIEASRFVKAVYAVEQKPERVADIKENIRRFGAITMEVVGGKLPDAARALPDPHVVFIGGGGKNLDEIIRMAASRMKEDGKMVVNTVLIQSLSTAVTTLEEEGFNVEVLQMSVSISSTVAWDMMLKGTNPVFIVTGTRGDA
ncbi:MAG: precorrin-6y C5,15-methyltransferase (decarboxylating) subunit CbiE [Desulfobacterales bacterium]|nr:precorrin-6y C5,15-methyltransferase (decarboxylating) subunit CbiE [Desulfobacterales bacterium]